MEENYYVWASVILPSLHLTFPLSSVYSEDILLMQQEAEALPKLSVLNTLQSWSEKQIPDNKLNIFYWEQFGAWLHWQWLKILRDWSETCWENPDFENMHLSARCVLWQQVWGRKTTGMTKLRFCFQTKWKIEIKGSAIFWFFINPTSFHQTFVTYASWLLHL